MIIKYYIYRNIIPVDNILSPNDEQFLPGRETFQMEKSVRRIRNIQLPNDYLFQRIAEKLQPYNNITVTHRVLKKMRRIQNK
ncbi:hypothetical protein GJ496_004820 [Pomphorhynchus laevis]|nr:hypothetical protein GJ496_004820 [Pomphorhynchus laevis]